MKLELQNIEKHFHRKHVLEGVSLSADPGTCIGILGENGCGKSTLLSILAGVLKPDQGAFLWESENLFREEKLRQSVVGYVPQGTPLLQELTALDNLRLWYRMTSRDLKQDLKDGVPAMMGVDEFLHVPVRKLSGGMKKRLSISCAVAGDPRLLLLDEPSAALDLVARERIGDYIQNFKQQGGILLLTTHDAREMELCDCWFLLKKGVLEPYFYDGDTHRLAQMLGA